MIKIWRYWIVRPKALFVISQFALLMAVFFFAVWDGQRSHPALSVSGGLGLILLLTVPQLCWYLSGMENLILDPNFRIFVSRTLFSMVTGVLLTLPLFLIFPHTFPGYKGALVAIGFSTLMLFALRPLLQWLVRHRRFVEGLLILGTADI